LPIAKPAPAWADAPRRRTEDGHVGRSKPQKSLELEGNCRGIGRRHQQQRRESHCEPGRRYPTHSGIKELIHEEFGDGIMSAIDFSMDITRLPDARAIA